MNIVQMSSENHWAKFRTDKIDSPLHSQNIYCIELIKRPHIQQMTLSQLKEATYEPAKTRFFQMVCENLNSLYVK